jgi:hypothetical protein
MTDRKAFFSLVRLRILPTLTQGQVDGINAILDAWDKWAPNSDPRFIAYALATAYWETDRTLQPIAEYGHGHGHSYGVSTGPWHKAYFGRGYVQLTWIANYKKATEELQNKGIVTKFTDFVKDPDLVLKPEIAAPIMIFGMLEGWFTGRKLGDFFHGRIADWTNARTIINGHDHAAEIANNARLFFQALAAQQHADGPH